MRRDPIYPTTSSARRRPEDDWLGKATERIFLPLLQMTLPEIVDYDLPIDGRVPQLLHRLDQEGVPGARAQGDARDLGHRRCCR